MFNPYEIKNTVPGFIKNNKYKHSGICPTPTLRQMLWYGLRTGVIVGIVGYFAGLLIRWIILAGIFLAAFLGNISAILGFVIIVLVYIGYGIGALGYPAFLGVYIGLSIDGQAEKGKCRNPKLARVIGFFSALVGYAIFSLLAIQLTGYPQLTSRVIDPLSEGSNVPGWFYILIFVDAILVAGVAAKSASESIAKAQFCEKDEAWYKPSVQKFVRVDTLASIYATLSSGSTDPMKKVDLSLPNLEPPLLSLLTNKCPACKSSDINILCELMWDDKKIENGKTVTTKRRTLPIFSTMTSYELGREIETLLTVEEAKPEEG